MASSSRPNPSSLKHVLHSEILSVTSVMRKNSRWSSTTNVVIGARDPRMAIGSNMGLRIATPNATRLSGRGSKEAELMLNFIELKRALQDVQGQVDISIRSMAC